MDKYTKPEYQIQAEQARIQDRLNDQVFCIFYGAIDAAKGIMTLTRMEDAKISMYQMGQDSPGMLNYVGALYGERALMGSFHDGFRTSTSYHGYIYTHVEAANDLMVLASCLLRNMRDAMVEELHEASMALSVLKLTQVDAR